MTKGKPDAQPGDLIGRLEREISEHEKRQEKLPSRTKRALDIVETVIDGFSVVGMVRVVLAKLRDHTTKEHREEIARLKRANRDLISVNAALARELNRANAHLERLTEAEQSSLATEEKTATPLKR
ncbi:hypothetical protein [Rhodovulum sulfidophilum]|uniref:hypothetical protein n=1 Tax=Rhodovulum sulfidophilum TaxID=35806 RepID=UPI001920DB4B|nr:hypothetical protein [Rhodovulum sulfidophilum]MBL3560160.1 hypothetical protein [Rhodovulum sulfidophilum]